MKTKTLILMTEGKVKRLGHLLDVIATNESDKQGTIVGCSIFFVNCHGTRGKIITPKFRITTMSVIDKGKMWWKKKLNPQKLAQTSWYNKKPEIKSRKQRRRMYNGSKRSLYQ
jgi:hypothetical protein